MPTVVVIGVFDGVHRGHQALIDAARTAGGDGADLVALTFDPHPARVLAPQRAPAQLLTLADRCAELERAGVARTVVVPFTRELSQWSPERFVDDIVLPLRPAAVCVGANFRFGHGAAGDVQMLEQMGAARGFTVVGVPLAGDGPVWSSSRVRALIADGDVSDAAEILGRAHRLVGTVVHGDARGRELGFPTANVAVDHAACVPRDGVYAGRLSVPGRGVSFCAAISIGTNPQFSGDQRRIEAYALDAPSDLDIYDEQVRLGFLEHIRPQQVYAGVPELIDAIADDVAAVRRICGARV